MKKLLSTLLFLFVVAIISLSAQNRVYAPVLVEPEDGDDGQMPDVTLNWAAVAGTGGIVEYELQVDIDAAFPDPVIFPWSEFTGKQMEDLLFATQYYWRVRAKDGGDISDWSEIFTFTIFETLDLDKPNNNAEDQNPDVLLKAKPRIGSAMITGIDHYDFQADTSMNFDSPLLYEGSNDTNLINAQYLHFGETYNWRARARHDAAASAWSETRSFTLVSAIPLEAPANNSTYMGLENVLEWNMEQKPVTGIIDYTVQIAHDEIFTNPMSMNVEANTYTTDGYLTFGQDYYWRVRGNHATDTSDWSETWMFTTAETVSLASPANGAVEIGINPLLEWNEIAGVDHYQVEYNLTNNFDDPCCHELIDGSENFFQVVFILENETTYYWRVRTMKGVDTTAWSEVWSFTTIPEDFGIEEEAFDASNINIYPNPSNGKLHIDIAGDDAAEVSVHIMDLLGQVHLQEEMMFGIGNNNSTFDLSNLSNGIYIVRLTRGDQSYSSKITLHK